MGKRDVRVDKFIAKSAEFARPILEHFRELVHAACPDVEETLKWSMPFFDYEGPLCGMAAFKAHCAIIFWKGRLIFKDKDDSAMGHLGRVTKLTDLPSNKVLKGYIKEAVRLNETGIKVPRTTRPREKKELVVPEFFMAALKKNKKALTTFENFTYSHKKEYAEWLGEAKREETRQMRLARALKWLSEGKSRHWQYQRC